MNKLIKLLIVVLSVISIILPPSQVTCEEPNVVQTYLIENEQTPVFGGVTFKNYQVIVYQNPQTHEFTIVQIRSSDNWTIVDRGTGSFVRLPDPTGPVY